MAVEEPIVCRAVDVGSQTFIHHFGWRAFEWDAADDILGLEELIEAGFRVCADVEPLGGDWFRAFGINRPFYSSV